MTPEITEERTKKITIKTDDLFVYINTYSDTLTISGLVTVDGTEVTWSTEFPMDRFAKAVKYSGYSLELIPKEG